jgi:hypothetical protein
MLGLGNCDV